MNSNNTILGLSYKKLSSKIAKTRTIIWIKITIRVTCYDFKSLEWDERTNSCIRVNTRELDRELFTK